MKRERGLLWLMVQEAGKCEVGQQQLVETWAASCHGGGQRVKAAHKSRHQAGQAYSRTTGLCHVSSGNSREEGSHPFKRPPLPNPTPFGAKTHELWWEHEPPTKLCPFPVPLPCPALGPQQLFELHTTPHDLQQCWSKHRFPGSRWKQHFE